LKGEDARKPRELARGSSATDAGLHLTGEAVDLLARPDRERVELEGVEFRRDVGPAQLLEARERRDASLDAGERGERRHADGRREQDQLVGVAQHLATERAERVVDRERRAR
jgi:hypothetical protein